MTVKLPKEKRDQIRDLSKQGSSIKEIMQQVGVSRRTAYLCIGGYNSWTEYRDAIARQKGYLSHAEYQEAQAREEGFASRTDKRRSELEERGFSSYSDHVTETARRRGMSSQVYRRELAERRQEMPLHRQVSTLLNTYLTRKGQSIPWLSAQTKIPKATLYTYFDGRTIPPEEKLRCIAQAIRIPQETLDLIVAILMDEL